MSWLIKSLKKKRKKSKANITSKQLEKKAFLENDPHSK